MSSSSVDIHQDRILILDFGSQYTQLIARRIRELGVYCEIHSSEITESQFEAFEPNGVVLSGGPESVTEEHTPRAPAYSVHQNRAGARDLLRHANHGRATGWPCRLSRQT